MRLVRRPVPPITDGAWPDHVPPLLRRIYAARGAHAHEFIQRITGTNGAPGGSMAKWHESIETSTTSCARQREAQRVDGVLDVDGELVRGQIVGGGGQVCSAGVGLEWRLAAGGRHGHAHGCEHQQDDCRQMALANSQMRSHAAPVKLVYKMWQQDRELAPRAS